MKNLTFGGLAVSIALLVSGCSLVYPNWGTDQNPSTSMSPSELPVTQSPSPQTSSSESSSPTREAAKIGLIDLSVDSAAATISVVAEITNATEDGGKCTITFRSGAASKTVAVRAEANAVTTQCFPALLPTSGLPKGKGTVTITYESEKFFGVSQPFEVTIP